CPSLHLQRTTSREYELSHNWQYFLKSQCDRTDTNQPLAATGTEIWLRILIERLPSIEPGQQSLRLRRISLDPRLDGKINDIENWLAWRSAVDQHRHQTGAIADLSVQPADKRPVWLPRDPPLRLESACGCVLPFGPAKHTDQWRQEVTASAGRVCPRLPTSFDARERRRGVAACRSGRYGNRACWGLRGFCQCRVRFEAGIVGGLEACGTAAAASAGVANLQRDGAWSAWSSWSRCGADRQRRRPARPAAELRCAGSQTRSRRCDSPRPRRRRPIVAVKEAADEIDYDSEDAAETEERVCQAADECQAWSGLERWSACSQRCGTGSRAVGRRQCRAEGSANLSGRLFSRDSRAMSSLCPGRAFRLAIWPGLSPPANRWLGGLRSRVQAAPDAAGAGRQWLEVELGEFHRNCATLLAGNCRQEASGAAGATCVAMDANACDGTGRRKRQRGLHRQRTGQRQLRRHCSGCDRLPDERVCEAYSDWSQWSSCSRIESGTRSRSRSCRRVANCQAAAAAAARGVGPYRRPVAASVAALRRSAPNCAAVGGAALKVGGSASIGESGKLSYRWWRLSAWPLCWRPCLASRHRASANAGCRGMAVAHPGPPPPPRYQRSTSATEPRRSKAPPPVPEHQMHRQPVCPTSEFNGYTAQVGNASTGSTLPSRRGQQQQRRVSSSSQTDGNSLRRPVRAATYAPATSTFSTATAAAEPPPRVHRQQSEPAEAIISDEFRSRCVKKCVTTRSSWRIRFVFLCSGRIRATNLNS
uniref:TSP1_spondin domain-containing protein n=1 Tax=Macrostomum lignano TaxID=282301 RepID=A0A1I8FF26_9PLAT